MAALEQGRIPTDVLLRAYREKVVAQIKEYLMKDIEPIVEKAAQDAAAELETVLHERVNHLRNETVLHIETTFNRKPKASA